MKHLIQTQYVLSAVLASNMDTGRKVLVPMVEVTMTLAGTESRPPGIQPKLDVEAFRIDEAGLRELAAGYLAAADELKALIEPMVRPDNPKDRAQAVELAAYLVGLEREAAGETSEESRREIQEEIDDLVADLARSGWSFSELKREIQPPPEHGETCGCGTGDDPFAKPLGEPPKTGTVAPLVPQHGDILNVGHGTDAVALRFRDRDDLDPAGPFDVNIGPGLQETASNAMMTAFVHGWTLGVEVVPEGLVVVGCVKNEDVPAEPSIYPVDPVAGESISFGDVTLVFTHSPVGHRDVRIGLDVGETARNLIETAQANGIFLELKTDAGGITITKINHEAAPAAVEQVEQEQQESDDDSGEFEWITADVDEEGDLSWRYRCKGADRDGSMAHDEDVSDWSDDDIIELTMTTLSVPEHQRDLIKIERD